MAREISAPNILDGVVTEIGRSGNVANIAVDVGNGNYFYSYINRDAFGRLDLRKDDHVKVIFPSTNVVLTPAEPKYTFSSPNFLQGKVEEVKENIVTLNIGSNKIIANLAPWKAEWKKGDEVRAIVKPDDDTRKRKSGTQIKGYAQAWKEPFYGSGIHRHRGKENNFSTC